MLIKYTFPILTGQRHLGGEILKVRKTSMRYRPAPLGGPEFDFIAGNPVLDFHNTVAWPPRGKSNDRLPRPVDLVRWGEESGIVTTDEARRLRGYCIRNGSRSRSELADTLRLRDLVHHLFSNLAEGRAPADAPIATLNQQLKTLRSRQRIEWKRGHLRWSPVASRGTSMIMDRLALSAAELIISEYLGRLRVCGNPQCGWLFLDTTRNGLRKWCSMAECGGRAKSKRYYESQKKLQKRAARASD
jgi:predicted RNA-binding Zn ribbon-like protein